jgi:hypothetical protein
MFQVCSDSIPSKFRSRYNSIAGVFSSDELTCSNHVPILFLSRLIFILIIRLRSMQNHGEEMLRGHAGRRVKAS